jgi:HK97 family phage prohead protease
MTISKQKRHLWQPGRLEVRAEAEALRPGIAGIVQGVALTYGAVDSYGTMFAKGAAARSVTERVAARKVNVFLDHDASVRRHVGVVAAAADVGNAMVVDIEMLDTEDGRKALEYVRAVLAADATTGLSIGFVPRAWREVGDVIEFTEVELREISLTPVPSVPGAHVTGTRSEDMDDDTDDLEMQDVGALLERALTTSFHALSADRRTAVLAALGYTPTPTDSVTEGGSTPATYTPADGADTRTTTTATVPLADRVKLVRQTVACKHHH